MAVLIGFTISIGAGFGISWLIAFLLKHQKIYQARGKAKDIIQSAKQEFGPEKEHILNRIEEYRQNLLEQKEQEQEQIQLWIQDEQQEQELIRQNQQKSLQKLEHKKKQQNQETTACMSSLQEKKSLLKQTENQWKQKQKEYLQFLQKKFSENLEQLKQKYIQEKILKAKNRILQHLKKNEEHFKHSIKDKAHFILELALARFQHPYCAERGIKSVEFFSRKNMEQLFGSDLSGLKILEKECGVDLKVSDTAPEVTVFGIDPARRELGRICLQKLKRKKQMKTQDIKNLVHSAKKELFRRIHQDGERIAQHLKLKNLQQPVKNLMGVLRYRYSFAQNQYFHCLEVGWLCGLLLAELENKGDIISARRAGMLHDIGKAIDHSKEGGHAVIGADFIQQHGESDPIVQAVRAHHHDVSPDQPLDFLVIGADALSGARPGARRSTVESYTQKILTLEKIGKSFKGVKDTYIMSAGREIRVIVDSQKVNDLQALQLSKKIAGKIEEECSYPGLIKVTVMRTVTQNINLHQLKAAGRP